MELVEGGVIRVRVRAPAEGGKANEAVVRVLAERLGVLRSQVRVVLGASSRRKVVEVPLSSAEVALRLGAPDR